MYNLGHHSKVTHEQILKNYNFESSNETFVKLISTNKEKCDSNQIHSQNFDSI